MKHMTWFVMIPIGILIVAFIIFLVVRNLKDEKEFGDQLKNDYPKIQDEEDDLDIDEVVR